MLRNLTVECARNRCATPADSDCSRNLAMNLEKPDEGLVRRAAAKAAFGGNAGWPGEVALEGGEAFERAGDTVRVMDQTGIDCAVAEAEVSQRHEICIVMPVAWDGHLHKIDWAG